MAGAQTSRTAMVTGGASGIGAATCRRLADAGHRVAVLDFDAEGAERVATELSSGGTTAIPFGVDVADEEAMAAVFGALRAQLGPVEILVTSAGISSFAALTEVTLDVWNRIVAVNLTGTFLALRAVLPDMVTGGWGRVVTISSAAARNGPARLGAYCASKGGVIALTKSVSNEYGSHGITANAILPGPIDTPMVRRAQTDGEMPPSDAIAARLAVGRMGTPDDIAAMCAFLCSEGAGFVTGEVIGVSGGST